MKPATRSFYELAVQRAAEQVIADLDPALDLQALARGAALSSFHFRSSSLPVQGSTFDHSGQKLR